MNQETFSTSGSAAPDVFSGGFQGQNEMESNLGQKAEQTVRSAGEEVEKLKQAAREQAGTAVEQVKAGAQSAVQQAQEAGRTFLGNQKESIAQKLDGYADAVRAVSERLRGEEGNMLAGPAGQAAEQLERLSGYLRNAEPADFLSDLEGLARRRPEVVFGGLFVAGLAAARFLKASRRASSPPRAVRPSASTYQSALPRPMPPPPGTFPAAAGRSSFASTGSSVGSAMDHPFTAPEMPAASSTPMAGSATFPTL